MAEIKFLTADEPLEQGSFAWSIIDDIVEGVVLIDAQGIILRVNRALADMFGYRVDDLIDRNVSILMPSPHRESHGTYLSTFAATGQGKVIGVGRELEGMHRDGELFPIELSVSPTNLGTKTIFTGVLRDITERKESDQRLRQANRVMRAVNNALANVINEGTTKRELFDTVLNELLDITTSEYGFIGEILHAEGLPYLKTYAITNIAWNHETRRFYKENVRNGLEFRNLDTLFGYTIRTGQMVISNEPMSDARRGGLPKGHPRLERYLGIPIYSGSKFLGMAGIANRPGGYDEDLVEQIHPLVGAIGTLIAAQQNMQSRRLAEDELYHIQQRLKQMATIDPLTEVPNRNMLFQELEAAYGSHLNQLDFSVLFVDVDHFKRVNDERGHDIGDKVLKLIAGHLREVIRPTDIVGRYGGEEFVIGLPGCSINNALLIAERIRAAIESDPDVSTTVCIGMASLEQRPSDLAELIRWADSATYAAKSAGRNRVHLHAI